MNSVVPIKDEMFLPRRYGLVPESMAEAMKLAEMMAGATLVPSALQKKPADCLMVIQQAIRWDMDPFAVAQECSVIQGKLMHSGKLVAAVVNARGNLSRRLSFEYSGDGDDRTIVVRGTLHGEPEPRDVKVVLRNAKTQNAMWQKQPDQQLMYHGTRVWARRHTPELMLGVNSPEEFDEAPITSKRPTPSHDAETGEVIDDSDFITAEQVADINALLIKTKTSLTPFLGRIKRESLTQIPSSDFQWSMDLIKSNAEKRAKLEADQKRAEAEKAAQ